MPSEHANEITYIGQTNYRNVRKTFGIKQADRRSHMYIVGKTGTGKSTLLETLVRQDIAAGRGCALLDPHGDVAQRIASEIPHERQEDLIYFNVPDARQPLGFNPLAGVPPTGRVLAASGILDAFKKIWADSWGPRLEHILRSALLALVEQPYATLADVLRLFDDPGYRKRAAERVANVQVRQFWLSEYERYPARLRAEAIAPIQNKVGAFLANPILGRILTQRDATLNLRQVMDDGRILLVNVAKGRLGEDTASLLGALLVSMMGVAALSRADLPESKRRDFHVFLDEFHTFTTLSLAGMLSELRKYRVSLVLAHQFLSQLDERVRDGIMGNVGTMMCFRVGATDAEMLEKEFYPEIRADDLVRLPNYMMYLKLMIDGVVSKPFSAETLPSSEMLNHISNSFSEVELLISGD